MAGKLSLKITLDKKSTVFYIRINNSGCQLLAGLTRIKTFYRSLLNLQKGLHSLYYGLNVCGETIKIDANQIVPGNYPDFYATDLNFGADCSNWDALLKLWFSEE